MYLIITSVSFIHSLNSKLNCYAFTPVISVETSGRFSLNEDYDGLPITRGHLSLDSNVSIRQICLNPVKLDSAWSPSELKTPVQYQKTDAVSVQQLL